MKKCSDPWVNVDNQREEEIVNRKCCSKRITKKDSSIQWGNQGVFFKYLHRVIHLVKHIYRRVLVLVSLPKENTKQEHFLWLCELFNIS